MQVGLHPLPEVAGLGARPDEPADPRIGIDLSGQPEITEADALVAYLQQLGTHVDMKLYDDAANIR